MMRHYTDDSPDAFVVPSHVLVDWRVRLDLDPIPENWPHIASVCSEMYRFIETAEGVHMTP